MNQSLKMLVLVFCSLLVLFGAVTTAKADATRLDDWRVVSRYQSDRGRFVTLYSHWVHIAGNEVKSQEDYEAETGKKEPAPDEALAAALSVAQANPTDDLAVLALQFVVINSRTAEQQAEYLVPAVAILKEHYTTDDRIEIMLLGLARFGSFENGVPDLAKSELTGFLEEVIAGNEPGTEMRVNGALFFVMENLRSVNNLLMDEAWREKTLEKSIEYAHLAAAEGEGIKSLGKPADEWAVSMLNVLETQSIGGELPDVTAKIVKGGEDTLSNHRGKVVLIDFWATWCVPCIATLPKVVELNEKMAGKPFEVITVSIDSEEELVVEFMAERMDLPFVNWFIGDNSDTYRDWNLTGVPYYFLLDHNGTIQGRGDWDGLAEKAMELVEAM